jgi:hypothetical protein
MRLEKTADTRSPWYEAFTLEAPAGVAAMWVVTSSETPAAAEPVEGAADEDWATEALFDYYNG